VKVFTFNSARKSMSTVIRLKEGGYRLFTKGASEMVLRQCSHILDGKGVATAFGRQDRENLANNVIEPMASYGLRTICLAYRDFHPGRWMTLSLVWIA
jgi:magnesium-transporting ATPase (P-type)